MFNLTQSTTMLEEKIQTLPNLTLQGAFPNKERWNNILKEITKYDTILDWSYDFMMALYGQHELRYKTQVSCHYYVALAYKTAYEAYKKKQELFMIAGDVIAQGNITIFENYVANLQESEIINRFLVSGTKAWNQKGYLQNREEYLKWVTQAHPDDFFIKYFGYLIIRGIR